MNGYWRQVRDVLGQVGNRTTVVVCLFAVQVAVGLGVMWSNGVRSESPVRMLETGGTVVDSSGGASLEGAWPGVMAEAAAWHGDARLVLVGAQYDWPLSPAADGADSSPVGGWLTFVFMREVSDGAESLSVLVERRSGVVVRKWVRTVGIEPPGGQVEMGGWAISSEAALAVAEAAGGEEFRKDCMGARHVTRIGLEAARGASDAGAYWVVTYQDSRVHVAPALRVRVDAVSGEVIAETPAAAEAELAALEACQG